MHLMKSVFAHYSTKNSQLPAPGRPAKGGPVVSGASVVEVEGEKRVGKAEAPGSGTRGFFVLARVCSYCAGVDNM